MKPLAIACLVAAVVAVSATAEILEQIVYTPTSLPSAQGWDFFGVAFDEADVVSVDGGILTIDTMGGTTSNPHLAYYRMFLPDYPEARFVSFRTRARVLDIEFQPGSWHRAFCVSSYYTDSWMPAPQFGISPVNVWEDGLPIHSHDGTTWHDYTVSIDLEAPETATLIIDGTPIGAFASETNAYYGRLATFGDHGATSNALTQIAEIEITISTPDPVPTLPQTLTTVRSLFH